MKRLAAILLAMLAACFCAAADDVPTVVIAPFTAVDGVEQSEVNIIQQMFTSQYAGTGKAKVVDRSKFNLIQEQMKFQSSDWSNSDKVAEFGRALNAAHVITGEFTKFPKGVFVNIQVLDVNTTMIISSITPALIVNETLDVIDLLPQICDVLASKAVGESSDKTISAGSAKKSGATTKTDNPEDLAKKIAELEAEKLAAEKKAAALKYKIGDTGPGGGYVFFISEEPFDVYDGKGGVEKCYGLEVSKEGLGSMPWCTCHYPYCKIDTDYKIGYGKSNTYKIVTAEHPGGALTTKNCAAYACYEYKTSTTERGDWFLPSVEELLEISYFFNAWANRDKRSSSIENVHYSSSTLSSSGRLSWNHPGLGGFGNLSSKSEHKCVRAVHAF